MRRGLLRGRDAGMLSKRWYALRPIASQMEYIRSPHRFNVVPAGRRSGKTERAKRKLVYRALDTSLLKHPHAARFFAAAPTRDQAKRIWWDDLCALSKPYWAKPPLSGELMIFLQNQSMIAIIGLDKPQRIEGTPWDGGVVDEIADVKADAWTKNIRPALSDRQGWCDLIGVPEGRNHYYELYEAARARMLKDGRKSEWGAYTWHSAQVLPPEEIAAAKADLDELVFDQEYGASFINFQGRAYYNFGEANKLPVAQLYNPRAPLLIMFDFNVAPGVAVVAQEIRLATLGNVVATCVIGEVWIPDASNTELVCARLVKDWATRHQGTIEVYGDATGGARKTSGITGSDWDIVRRDLRRGFGANRVAFYVPNANPTERNRVNAMNTRCRTHDGTMRLLVDPSAAPHVAKDLDGVQVVEGGSGEIDKKKNKVLTHISDALGYYVVFRFPIGNTGVSFSTTLRA